MVSVGSKTAGCWFGLAGMHNLHEQLSQYHEFIFYLNVDRDGASLISVGTKFHN